MMFKICLALSAVIFAVNALAPVSPELREFDAEWEAHMSNHSLKFESTDHHDKAKAQFAKTHAQILKHNSDPNATYKMQHSKFSHMTDDERNAYTVRPSLPSSKKGSAQSSENRMAEETFIAEMRQSFPDSIDYRNDYCMQKIKNQVICGSCYAFTAVAVFEFAYCQAKQKKVTFSEQHVIDCAGFGCKGGWMDDVFEYIAKNGALEGLSDYQSGPSKWWNRITGTTNTCKIAPKNPPLNPPYITYVALKYPGNPKENVKIIKSILVKKGIVGVIMHTNFKFQLYKNGVFSDPNCYTAYETMNHAVTIVGYGTDSKTGLSYWIVRNSWGDFWGLGWGISGYAYVQSGVNMCGIEWNLSYITSVDGVKF